MEQPLRTLLLGGLMMTMTVLSTAVPAFAKEITVTVEEIDTERPGHIMVMLYSEDGFPKDHAKAKGANAIICFRFQTSTIPQGASEILAYGTGVKINK